MVLATLNINGKPTKVVMDANRNGFFYVLDRTNGKLIAANQYVQVNWANGIDMKTGRPIETDVTVKARAGEQVVVWPSISAARTGADVVQSADRHCLCQHAEFRRQLQGGAGRIQSRRIVLWRGPQAISGSGRTAPRGYLKAIDPLTGKAKWEAPSDIPRFSGVLSTAGGLVFTGKLTGEFEAFDADNGNKLWQFQTGSGIEGQPVTWQQDGVQYVAVSVGIGGVYSLFSGDERLAAVPAGGSLWVFAAHPVGRDSPPKAAVAHGGLRTKQF